MMFGQFLQFIVIVFYFISQAMEKVYEKGLVKAIGLSNFPIDWIQRVLDVAKLPIANLQVSYVLGLVWRRE